MYALGFLRQIAPLMAVAFLAACGDKLNLESYNKVRAGQTYDEVKQILGDPVRCDEALGVRTCVWGDDQRGINVNFLAGQVILHSAHNLK